MDGIKGMKLLEKQADRALVKSIWHIFTWSATKSVGLQ